MLRHCTLAYTVYDSGGMMAGCSNLIEINFVDSVSPWADPDDLSLMHREITITNRTVFLAFDIPQFYDNNGIKSIYTSWEYRDEWFFGSQTTQVYSDILDMTQSMDAMGAQTRSLQPVELAIGDLSAQYVLGSIYAVDCNNISLW